MIHQWITVFKRQGDYRLISLQGKKGSTVTCQLQNRCHLFCCFFVKRSRRTHPTDNVTYGCMARWPLRTETHLKNTQAYICHSPNGFLCDKVNYSCPQSRGNTSLRIVLLQSSAFYEQPYFYSIYIYINKSWCADSESAVSTTAQAPGRAAFVFCQCLH